MNRSTREKSRRSLTIAGCAAIAVSQLAGNLLSASGDVIAMQPRQWEFIVIHHSATRAGSAEIFDASHRARGMINGLAYHFVIDNGTEGTQDGFIETGSRWVRQIHGGHCKQAHVNERGIGICLVGNFSSGSQPTPKQIDSLVLLIRGLQDQFQIPADHIVGHGDVFGEFSECPGRDFPWTELRRRLAEKPVEPSAPVVRVESVSAETSDKSDRTQRKRRTP